MNGVTLTPLDSSIHESTLSLQYKLRTRDGRELRSTSLVLCTPEGKLAIAFCIDLDLSTLTAAKLWLQEISEPQAASGETLADDDAQTDIEDIVTRIIDEALIEVGGLVKFMGREDRLRAVGLMHGRGLFLIRGSVEKAAAALGISRFTLYGYLREVRNL